MLVVVLLLLAADLTEVNGLKTTGCCCSLVQFISRRYLCHISMHAKKPIYITHSTPSVSSFPSIAFVICSGTTTSGSVLLTDTSDRVPFLPFQGRSSSTSSFLHLSPPGSVMLFLSLSLAQCPLLKLLSTSDILCYL